MAWAPLARKPAATDGRSTSAGSGSTPGPDGTASKARGSSDSPVAYPGDFSLKVTWIEIPDP
jgi:hypothetical protein